MDFKITELVLTLEGAARRAGDKNPGLTFN
jgi:hypothetical protein